MAAEELAVATQAPRTEVQRALSYAESRAERVAGHVIEAFVEAGVGVPVVYKDGRRPLHYASFSGYPEAIKALVAAGGGL